MEGRDQRGAVGQGYDIDPSRIELFAPESEERANALHRALRRSKGFSLHVLVADGLARREILRRLRAWSGTGGVPILHFFAEGEAGAKSIERWLVDAWESEPLTGAVLPDGNALVADGKALSALNVARDRLGQLIRGPCLMVVSPRSETEMAKRVPDLFDVRAGTWEFEAAPISTRALARSVELIRDRVWPEGSKGDLQIVAASLRALGSAEAPPPPGALANAWLKLGRDFLRTRELGEAMEAANEAERYAKSAAYTSGIGLAISLKALALVETGRSTDAERLFRDSLDYFRRAGFINLQAMSLHYLGSILLRTGRLNDAYETLDAARSLWRDEKNEHNYAVTCGLIASIHAVRGEFDEALRIHQEEGLPVYERLHDEHNRAITWSRIADILFSRGQDDEALRIHREEVLPIHDKLGNVRERAVTWSKIADILQQRGQLDEAFRIRSQEELPVFEALEYVRERAVTWGKIAAILESEGKLTEAFRIRTEEELPVLERLNDVRELLVAQGNLAVLHLTRNEPGDRSRAAELLRSARAAAEDLYAPELQWIIDIQSQAGLGDSEDNKEPSRDDSK